MFEVWLYTAGLEHHIMTEDLEITGIVIKVALSTTHMDRQRVEGGRKRERERERERVD